MSGATVYAKFANAVALTLALTGSALADPVPVPGAAPGMLPQNLPQVDHPAPVMANSAGFYGLEHTHIFTADIDRCIHFYVDLLGFTQATKVNDTPVNPRMDNLLGFKNAHYKQMLLNMPGGPTYGTHVPQIEVWQVSVDGEKLDKTLYDHPTGNLQGKGYNAYRVKNLGEVIKRLKAAGVKFVSEPNINAATGLPGAVYMIDPDGQLIEMDNWFGQDSK
jgi:catechol 2,3-dioxygenase-like lactoylglutathione lyase family enzyme